MFGTCGRCDALCDHPARQCFHVVLCGAARAGVTVSLTGPGSYSDVTDGSGNVCFDLTDSGVYTWTASKTGAVTQTGTFRAVCGDTGATVNVTLALDTGYSCTGATCCDSETGPPYKLEPLLTWPTTLTLNDGIGNVTLTCASPGSSGPWVGTATRHSSSAWDCTAVGGFGSCGAFVAGDVTIHFSVSCGGNLSTSVQWAVDLFYYPCRYPASAGACDPGGRAGTCVGTSGNGLLSLSEDTSCPRNAGLVASLTGAADCDAMSVSKSVTITAVASGTSGNAATDLQSVYGVSGSGVSIPITVVS